MNQKSPARAYDAKPHRPAFNRTASCAWRFGREQSTSFGSPAALAHDERGVAGVEYALICALIVLAIIGGIASLGGGVEAKWDNVDGQFDNSVTYSTR